MTNEERTLIRTRIARKYIMHQINRLASGYGIFVVANGKTYEDKIAYLAKQISRIDLIEKIINKRKKNNGK